MEWKNGSAPILKIIFVIIFCIPLAQASFLFSPYGGIQNLEFNENNRTGDVKGQRVGAHLGWQYFYFTIGLDVNYQFNEIDKGFRGSSSENYKGYAFGPFIGIGTNGVRMWVGARLTSLEMENSIDGYYFGEAYFLGMGFRVLNPLFLNIEYIKNTYDEQEIDDGETTSLSNSIKFDGLFVSVSLPFYF